MQLGTRAAQAGICDMLLRTTCAQRIVGSLDGRAQFSLKVQVSLWYLKRILPTVLYTEDGWCQPSEDGLNVNLWLRVYVSRQFDIATASQEQALSQGSETIGNVE